MSTRNKGSTRPLGGAAPDKAKRVKPRVPDAHLATPTQILLDSPLHGVRVPVDVDTDAKTLRALVPEPTIPEAPPLPAPPVLPAAPTGPTMISMKSPAEVEAEARRRKSAPVQVQLRSIADAQRHHSAPPGAYGYLAPPRATPDRLPAWVRTAAMVMTTLAIAAVVALAVWFLA